MTDIRTRATSSRKDWTNRVPSQKVIPYPISMPRSTLPLSHPPYTSAYTSPIVTLALAPNPNLLLTAFHTSTITTYTTVHAATTPHSHPIAPCLNTVLFTTGI